MPAGSPAIVLQMYQRTGLWAVTIMRWTFDKFTNYGPKMSEAKWMTRILFLETVAGACTLLATIPPSIIQSFSLSMLLQYPLG